ncbi:MAG: hypothetical protein AAFU03_13255, partial [Bacteroidota bacterium]
MQEGTDQEKAWLRQWNQARMSESEKRHFEEGQRNRKALVEKINAPQRAEDPEKRLAMSTLRMYATILRDRNLRGEPRPDLYPVARHLLWNAYCYWVKIKNKSEVDMKGRQDLLTALAQIAHWLVGLTEWQANIVGECIDPTKSLYIVGPVGTGKSTLAQAAASASKQLAYDYATGLKLHYLSLDEIVTKMKSQNSLKGLETLMQGHY